VVVIVKFRTTKEANNNVSRKGNNEKMEDLIIMCWSLLQHGNRLSNAVERVTLCQQSRKKEERNGTHIAKMHVGLANATAQTRGGRGEQ
jgi:hypothetical protein